tara:strand:- start:4515 stop:5363 length:849 start_codon:yes stop_codon:yes gene_type:complete
MAQPASRQELIAYCKRKLGAPVLEINVADEQIDDLVDDALQYFYERHFDGVIRTYLKYEITQADIDRGKGPTESGVTGITTTTATSTIDGATVEFNWFENSNYIQVPPSVIGVEKVFRFDGSNSISNNMFSIKYQLFLNDVAFNLGYNGLLSYAMTQTYLSDIDFLLTTEKHIRFNQRQDRLYLDIDWENTTAGNFIVMECFRTIDANDYSRVWNDTFLKRYLTALIKKQWGQNLIKFQGVKLPGGVELNGREIYEDGQKELDTIAEMMSNTYELPPLDFIG